MSVYTTCITLGYYFEQVLNLIMHDFRTKAKVRLLLK